VIDRLLENFPLISPVDIPSKSYSSSWALIISLASDEGVEDETAASAYIYINLRTTSVKKYNAPMELRLGKSAVRIPRAF
jgi:hypothetical protein